ncbi:outer membrane beta-barrel protein [Neomegalonema sp.]|uniref:outer membrane beta-barrel protein n=1 Tax=Neomegalonema sp. TaxID=2039713 RepID=UPI002635B15B|nr:outer membrane beta-barrel protein [Neomegalonema sp.]MDD2868613.1 outer membrane beta-barrel protein [Neomegalonema sp.]
MKLLTLSGVASGVATLLAGTAAAQAYGAYSPRDVFVSADVLRGSLNASAGAMSGAQYHAASEVVSSTGVLPASYAPVSYATSVAPGSYTSGTISAPITAAISGPMSGTFTGQITGTITGTITLNPVAPVTTTTYAAPAYVAPAPAPIYTPAPAPIYTPAPVVVSAPVYAEPVYVAPPAPAYVPPPPPAYVPPPPPVVVPVVVEPVADYCAPWGGNRNFYGQIGGGYAYAGDNIDGLRLASRGLDKNYHVAGGLGVRLRGQGVGCDDQVRVSLQNHYIRHELPRGGQIINGRRMLNKDAINGEAFFAQVEYAPDLGWGGIRPYIGAGVGAAGINVGDGHDGYENDWGFAYKGIAGVTFEVNPKLDLFAEYNYIGVPGVDLKTGSGRKDGEIDYDAHLVNMGLRYNF